MNEELVSKSLVRYERLSGAAAAATWLLIMFGAAVAFTISAKAIPDWPSSFGSLLPPRAGVGAVLEYIHRILAVITGLLIVSSAVMALVRFRSDPGLWIPPLLAAVFTVPVVFFGRLAVIASLTATQALLDLESALMVLSMATAAPALAYARRAHSGLIRLESLRSPVSLLAFASWVTVFIALALTVVTEEATAASLSIGWPAWARISEAVGGYGLKAGLQYAAVAAASVLVALTTVSAWITRREDPRILTAATVSLVLLLSGVLSSELSVVRAYPILLLALRAAFASALLAALVCLFAFAARSRLPSPAPAARGKGRKPGRGKATPARVEKLSLRRLAALVALTRPGVTLLLLAAAAAGFAAGAGSPGPWGNLAWMLLGLALTTGGAQALNQFIERDADARMARTSGRPLPSGRLFPAEGLAWGVGLCLAGLSVMTILSGLLAAGLTLAGMLWYVLLYTIALKKRTPQSIVIGGLAGALLPVIGSAAATGTVSWMAAFLGITIFLWTPPHFWAFALPRAEEYSAGGFPSAPRVYGERVTRIMILAGAVVLVASTILPPLLRIAGPVFLAAAILLGGAILAAAFILWRGRGSARVLYKLLSAYLGLILVFSVVDSLL